MTYNEIPAPQHSSAWVTFSYVSFGISLAMIVGGLYFLQMDPWVKAYFGMGAVLLTQSCFTLAKTLRDVHEDRRLINRLDQAKTEKLLTDVTVRS